MLLDGTFIFTALKYKLDITHRLESLLQETSLKLYALQSSIDELRAVGEKGSSALEWTLRCCEAINDTQFSAMEPIARMVRVIENAAAGEGKLKRRFFVATQDKDLRTAAARIPGIPVLYLNKVTMVLEPPSSASVNYRNTAEDVKASLGEEEAGLLVRVSHRSRAERNKEQEKGLDNLTKEATQIMQGMRPKHRPSSSPNPLSQRRAEGDSLASKRKKQGKFRKA